ncbi:VWA domain-containing protein [uncultured Mesonia sp.]|uniref:vWA domain-containing protein n=1 Tax=uncultured Mesonia sp. TaxID=399731 RepID=UPI00374F1214
MITALNDITFEHPQWFWLFLIFPFIMAWQFYTYNKQNATVKLSSLSGFSGDQGWLSKLKPILMVFRLLAIALLITAMARPRTVDVSTQTNTTQGVDIVMAIDVSASMLARDLKPNRLEALKEVASDFVQARPTDRIGLVVYAGESFTKTPITSDKRIVLNALNDIEYNTLIESGTAIGMGLATSVNRLKDSEAKSKVIILLTDGVNNAGFIDPKIATELALEYDIKTYTIGLGSNGMALGPVSIDRQGNFNYGRVPVEIDETLLKEIANKTGGQYFRATDNDKLEKIYEEINKLETTEIEEFKFYNYDEKYRVLVLIAAFLLLLEVLIKNTLLRSFV